MDDDQMSAEAKKQKDELLRLLSSMETRANHLEDQWRAVAQPARLARDIVPAMRMFVSQLPADSLSAEQWEHTIKVLRSWEGAASQLEVSPTSINTFVATSYAVASTSNTVMYVTGGSILPPTPEIQAARAQFNQVLERTPLVETARLSLRRLKLDHRGGGDRTPLEILDQAKAALDRPSLAEAESLPVLVALRECIDASIAELVRRRLEQEPAGSIRDKLPSLGRHCARPDLDADHFDRLATDWHSLSNRLSGAKQAKLSRQQVSELFHQGLVFLNALLDSIDETRLR